MNDPIIAQAIAMLFFIVGAFFFLGFVAFAIRGIFLLAQMGLKLGDHIEQHEGEATA